MLVDPGSRRHIATSEQQLSNKEKCNISLMTASGDRVGATTKGVIKTSVATNMGSLDIEMKEVLLLQGAKINLFSTTKVIEDGAEVVLRKTDPIIKLKNGPEIRLEYKGGQFYMGGRKDTSVCAALKDDILEWHLKLGHPSPSQLIESSKVTTGIPNNVVKHIKEFHCEECEKAKAHKMPYTTHNYDENPIIRTTEPNELIHIDMMDIGTASISGCRYALVVKDDYTKLTYVYATITKSQGEVGAKMIHHHNTHGRTKAVRMDNGAEFFEYRKWCIEHDIRVELSPPYTPQMNATVERENRTLAERTRATLASAGLGTELWYLAMRDAAWKLDRSYTRSIKMTPYERKTGKKPDLNYNVAFGTKVIVTTKPKPVGKLADRGTIGIYVGHATRAEGLGGYKILIGRKMIITREIKTLKGEAMPINNEHLKETSETSPDDAEEVEATKTMTHQGAHTPAQTPQEEPAAEAEEQQPQAEQPTPAEEQQPQAEQPTPEVEPPQAAARTTTSRFGEFNSLRRTELMSGNQGMSYNDMRKQCGLEWSSIRDNFGAGWPIAGVPESTATKQAYDLFNSATVKPNKKFKNAPLQANEVQTMCLSMAAVQMQYDEAMNTPESDEWTKAVDTEFFALIEKGVFTVEQRENVRDKIISTRWGMTRKADGRYRARLVARGFEQEETGVSTYAPTSQVISVRSMIVEACLNDEELHAADISTAFLYADLESEVYVKPPQGWEQFVKRNYNKIAKIFHQENAVWKLLKALYGLRESPRLWGEFFFEWLREIGFKQSEADPCLWTRKDLKLSVFVDDVMMKGTQKAIDEFKAQLKEKFAIRDLGEVQTYCGIDIKRDRAKREIKLSQRGFIDKLLKETNMDHCKPVPTPMEGVLTKRLEGEAEATIPYRKIMGSLNWLSTSTRPDISFAVGILASYNNDPGATHETALKRVLRYLSGTRERGLVYRNLQKREVETFTDASWAPPGGGPEDRRKSHSGCVVQIGGNTVHWWSKRQKTAALSSVEAEYIALSDASKDAAHLYNILKFLQEDGPIQTPKIWCDNAGAITNVKDRRVSAALKHIDLRIHHVRDRIISGQLDIEYIPTVDQIADLLTKAATVGVQARLIDKLMGKN